MKPAEVVAFLMDRVGEGFYGDITIRMREGKITMVSKVETYADRIPVKNPRLVELMETAGVRPAPSAADAPQGEKVR